MCYNYRLKAEAKDLEKMFNAKFQNDSEPIFDNDSLAFDHPTLPVITNTERDIIQFYRWGLIPAWAKTLDEAMGISAQCTLAKIETLAQKPSFRNIYNTQRCVVLATSYIEHQWHDSKGKKKEKFEVCIDEDAFALGGLYNIWMDPDSGTIYKTYCIVTTAANEVMSEIHNTKKRMPLIFKQSQINLWLDNKLTLEEYTEITHKQKVNPSSLSADNQTTLF